MIYKEKELEMEGVLQTARQMCTAARTAPKDKGTGFYPHCGSDRGGS
ncbi:hypothetical protein [Anaerostipes caccae]|nr:hypothetical protein [Anaerostipes caccae]